jgi:hypothetical protein
MAPGKAKESIMFADKVCGTLEPGQRIDVRWHSYRQSIGLQQKDKDFWQRGTLLISEKLTPSACQRLSIVLNMIKEF